MLKKIALVLIIAVLFIQAWPAQADEAPITLGGGQLTGLALSPDGTRLAAGSTIGLYFFDAQTFAITGFWPTPYPVGRVVWSPQGGTLALVNGADIEIRQSDTGAALWKHSYSCYRHCTVTFGRNGSQMVVLQGESTASVYDLTSGALVETIHDEAFWSFSDWRLAHLADSAWQTADGKLAFIGNNNGKGMAAFLYDVPRRLYITPIRMGYVSRSYDPARLALSPNGKLLAASETQSVLLWNIFSAATPMQTLATDADSLLSHAFAWSPDSAVLYVAFGNTLDAWDVKTGQRLRRLGGLFTPATGQITWSADGRRLIGLQDNQIGDWDLSTRQPTAAAPLTGYESSAWQVREMTTSPAGNLLAVADNAGVTLHDATTLGVVRRIQVGRTVTVLAFSPDGKLLATGGSGPFVNVWEAATGRPVVDLPASMDCHFILALAFAPGSQQVYALESTGRLRHWDVQTKASFTVQTKLPWSEYYYDPAIHVTAKRVAVEMRQTHTIAIADLETGESIYSVKAAWPRSVIINAQGARLAAIVDSTVKIWKLNTGEEVATYAGHTLTLNDIAFSPDGTRLASSSYDGTVQVWPVP